MEILEMGQPPAAEQADSKTDLETVQENMTRQKARYLSTKEQRMIK